MIVVAWSLKRCVFCQSLAYGIGQTIIFSSCGFYLLLLLFPRPISAAAHWMSTILRHMVWPYCEFRMQVWNVLRAARWKCRTPKISKNWPSGHHRTTSFWFWLWRISKPVEDISWKQFLWQEQCWQLCSCDKNCFQEMSSTGLEIRVLMWQNDNLLSPQHSKHVYFVFPLRSVNHCSRPV